MISFAPHPFDGSGPERLVRSGPARGGTTWESPHTWPGRERLGMGKGEGER